MKLELALLALVGCALSGQAAAQTSCAPTAPTTGGGRVANNAATQALTTALRNNTVCASRGGERWQEYHTLGNRVIDYKQGPNHAVDPSEDVGSWTISGSNATTTVTYNYGTGGTYSYAVFRDSNSPTSFYHFCGVSGPMSQSNTGNNIVNATIRTGQVSCN